MRLVTFPGQGTPISIPMLKSVIRNKGKEFQTVLDNCGEKSNDLLQFILKNPSSPGSIAACSNLYYQLYKTTETRPKKSVLLGHSLGELVCLSANNLFSLKDLFDIANYRNELMVQYTENYLHAHRISRSSLFEMWALSSPRARNLPEEVTQLLSALPIGTVSIANANSIKQCVVTGLVEDLESLRTELHLKIPLLRITELTNPFNIPFHNSTVLRPLQERLYDYIWQILKRNNTHTLTELDYPIIANLDGRISFLVRHALERFVKCSSNTVQFTMCYDTINNDLAKDLDEAVCIGPGNVIYNLIRRNCPHLKTYEYSSLTTIEKFHDAHVNDNEKSSFKKQVDDGNEIENKI
ncbi:hypothetical protein HG535_0F05330 [Zygotorulaspora mrakii]|uniref:[acyl-carrier-protein] S-malonyltransferase n=1 Tax=Zygotorulaspora mrakii TaxID=42260 RepID=A0A7H9B5N9_ZYGMR|nr:uncharacterized protein HG535_0F05330 [Zygotorulaspora mrakii]QLG74021.1 hypothetical protein HG535_0F05330 [Zygotorulaspora mrakii]